MFFRTIGWLTLSVLFLTLSGIINTVESQAQAKTSIGEQKKPANIKGFRSAKFGMKENDVFRAIKKDFRISKNKVKRDTSSLEKTIGLEIEVPKLFEVGGPAKIGYVFGYKSKKLIQVNIGWGHGVTKNVDAESVVAAANLLREYFLKKKYEKEGFIANGKLSDSTTIVFRGKDKKKRMTLLVLSLPITQKGETDLEKVALNLTYILDADKPDIMTVGEDDF
jgi:hypothetical protein